MIRLIFLLALVGGLIISILQEAKHLSHVIEEQQQNQRILPQSTTYDTAATTNDNNTAVIKSDRANNLSKNRTVYVDFYRTVEEKSCLGISYNSYSIPKWRFQTQAYFLNLWFAGRIRFLVGDIYTMQDPVFRQSDQDCFSILSQFRQSDEIRTKARISVLYMAKLEGIIFGCGVVDVPLNGKFAVPVVVVTMANDIPVIGSLGFQPLFGVTLAHEIGHVLGMEHTAIREEEDVASYTNCDLDLRYPQFIVGPFLNVIFQPSRTNSVWDDVTGERYEYSDWKGRSNLMATSLTPAQVLQVWVLGIFESRYEAIFDQILDCWFDRSAANANNDGSTADDKDGKDEDEDGSASGNTTTTNTATGSTITANNASSTTTTTTAVVDNNTVIEI